MILARFSFISVSVILPSMYWRRRSLSWSRLVFGPATTGCGGGAFVGFSRAALALVNSSIFASTSLVLSSLVPGGAAFVAGEGICVGGAGGTGAGRGGFSRG